MRTTQEMMWDAVDEAVMQDLPRLHKLMPRNTKKLTLRPALDRPRYVAALDTHCMPGSYAGEVVDGDLRTGALYDRAVHIYMLGVLGPYNQKAGEIVINYLRRRFPDLKPKTILDVGCGVGHATLPYAEAFPGAKITGVDVAAPMLRYAHARATALGHDIAFVQDNAEKLSFPDNSFDLVVSHILIHETSRTGLTNILRESWRVLKPVGVAIHVDGAGFAGKDLLEQYLADWDTYFNAQPFVGALHDLDLKALTRKAGIPASAAIVETTADGYARHTGGALKVVGGRKPR
jgi:ubiquinone/menaquinone biosynthesis C-methylase UbiE